MSLRRRLPRDAERGVTLVELMVVLVIIAVGVLALSGVQTHSSTDVYATGRRTRALALAENQMEVARGMGYVGAVSDSGASDVYNWFTVVDSTGLPAGLHRIRVTVNWTEAGNARSVQLIDLVSTR